MFCENNDIPLNDCNDENPFNKKSTSSLNFTGMIPMILIVVVFFIIFGNNKNNIL